MTAVALADSHIAEAAFFLWLEEGQPEGRAEEHWLRAKEALTAPAPKARVRRPAAKTVAAKKVAAPKAKAKAKAAPKTRAKKAAAAE